MAKYQTEPDINMRLGFAIDNFEETLKLLSNNDIIYSEPLQTDFGFLTVVSDPDGRKVELYKN